MKMKVIKCDICGLNMGDYARYKLKLSPSGELKKQTDANFINISSDKYDICPSCYNDIRLVIESMIGK